MKVLVDTSVWSLALRKRTVTAAEARVVREFRELIAELRVAMIGPVRQEVLSGISDTGKFSLLRERLQAFDDLPLSQRVFETAAEFSTRCRRTGIQGSHTDFLICAAAAEYGLSIFTTDQDFPRYADVLEFQLHQVRDEIISDREVQ